jgi:hypothetical protein
MLRRALGLGFWRTSSQDEVELRGGFSGEWEFSGFYDQASNREEIESLCRRRGRKAGRRLLPLALAQITENPLRIAPVNPWFAQGNRPDAVPVRAENAHSSNLPPLRLTLVHPVHRPPRHQPLPAQSRMFPIPALTTRTATFDIAPPIRHTS